MSTVRDFLQSRRCISEKTRIPVTDIHHKRANVDTRGDRGKCPKLGEALWHVWCLHRRAAKVIHRPEGVEARVICRTSSVSDVAPRHDAGVDLDVEPHERMNPTISRKKLSEVAS